jgi:hypothetical protein
MTLTHQKLVGRASRRVLLVDDQPHGRVVEDLLESRRHNAFYLAQAVGGDDLDASVDEPDGLDIDGLVLLDLRNLGVQACCVLFFVAELLLCLVG